MDYREHAPPPALRPFVTCFWTLDARGEPYRVLPDGAMDILFSRGESSAKVIGPMTKALVVDDAGETVFAGARFRPGAALEMLGVAARELRDESATLDDVWGADGRTLSARLAGALDADEMVRFLRDELALRALRVRAPDPRVARAVALLDANGGELPVPAVAERAGLGERQLERLFDERVGYGPKAFARVVRMRRATHAIARGTTASWARLAVECGYADQAHLVREFRALTGVTPRIYAAEARMSEIDNPERTGIRSLEE